LWAVPEGYQGDPCWRTPGFHWTPWGWNAQTYVTNNSTFMQDKPSVGNTQPWYWIQTMHPGTMNLALMDGSVRGVAVSISPSTWGRIMDPNDGQVVGDY
jgi:prepilin-type processing-associated H-X9-DG protein